MAVGAVLEDIEDRELARLTLGIAELGVGLELEHGSVGCSSPRVGAEFAEDDGATGGGGGCARGSGAATAVAVATKVQEEDEEEAMRSGRGVTSSRAAAHGEEGNVGGGSGGGAAEVNEPDSGESIFRSMALLDRLNKLATEANAVDDPHLLGLLPLSHPEGGALTNEKERATRPITLGTFLRRGDRHHGADYHPRLRTSSENPQRSTYIPSKASVPTWPSAQHSLDKRSLLLFL